MEPAAPERGLPTGPHPTVGRDTVRMPLWPGPVMAVVGALTAIGALLVATLQGALDRTVVDAPLLMALTVLGGVLFVGGLLYATVRQLRVRRHLAPDRYRGPSVLLLLLLAIVVAGLMTAPFTADAEALVLGEGELSLLGSAVLLVSTQVALLGVSWLFVFRPRALVGWPSWAGPNPVGSLLAGFGWGALAWLGTGILSVLITLLFEQLGLPAEPQAAEQALFVVDPVLAVVAIVILAPLAEELFFRGVVFNAWLREGGRRYAYVGSAILFAVIHLSLVAAVPIFLLGLALAWVYRRTGNLLAPIAMHAAVNGISVGVALLVRFGLVPMPA